MIAALFDYWRYRKRAGIYARRNWPGILARAFEGELPDLAITHLRPGDVILLGSMDSGLSWLVMYLSGAPISHVALYTGDGKIVHATTDGVVKDSITSLFGDHNLLQPWVAPLERERRAEVESIAEDLLGIPYGWRDVRRKALWRLTGRDWINFRLKFALDASLLLLIAGGGTSWVLGLSPWFAVAPFGVYLGVILMGYGLWRVAPPPFHAAGSPTDFLRIARRNGWRPVLKAGSQVPSGSAAAISTDLYVFAESGRLPRARAWVEKMGAYGCQCSLEVEELLAGWAGAFGVGPVGLNLSIHEATVEKERLGITRDLNGLDVCVRVDCDPDSGFGDRQCPRCFHSCGTIGRYRL